MIALAAALAGCAGRRSVEPDSPVAARDTTGAPDGAAPRPAPPDAVSYRVEELASVAVSAAAVVRPAPCSVAVSPTADPSLGLRTTAEAELGPWLRQCGLEASLQDEELSVQLAVGQDGCVTQVTIRAPSAGGRPGACIAAGFHGLRFAPSAGALVLRLPLRLSRSAHPSPPHRAEPAGTP